MDEKNNVLWSEGNQIVAFFKTTRGQKYQVTSGSVGRNTADFVKVTESGSGDGLFSGMEIDHIVALYPYSSEVDCSMNGDDSYKLNFSLPQTQYYSESSFGDGSFPMLAVSADNNIVFKNICGGLKLQFKGVDKIKSITLEGLEDEALSGSASVVGYVDGSAPEVTMSSSAAKSVTLDCGDGVQLYEDHATTFIITLPPMTFKSGMKLTVTDTDGLSKTLTNNSSNTIKRSSLLTFPVITYKQDGVLEFPEDAVTSFELPAEGGTVEIAVMTNQDYEVVIPDEAKDWINVVETKALREEVIKLSVSENLTPEVRFAEVLIATASGHITQTISLSQEKGNLVLPNVDYIDEYGINHGKGIVIGETVWAPVNCGYHAADFKYGKLYQWGRKYGQGFNGYRYVGGSKVECSDAKVPRVYNTTVSLSVGQDINNENEFYAPDTSDWTNESNNQLWNAGTESEPVKSEYDPCPIGWRVPTYAEMKTLGNNKMTTNEFGQIGFSFSGSKSVAEAENLLFLPLGGRWTYFGYADDRDFVGYYWTSRSAKNGEAYYYLLYDSYLLLDDNCRFYGCSVRCVQDPSALNLPSYELLDLSKEGTANSYIVSEPGAYKFTPTKGNSSESVGEIASAEVLWETFGTDVTPNKGDLVKDVKYEDGAVYFETPSEYKEGNAVIAAKDASGTILWSWHIWLTDEPEGQEYYNNAGTMMDRNLGATSATPGDVGALGLLYQWGRKDPFLGGSSISYESYYAYDKAKSTIVWPYVAVSSNANTGTIAYTTANPTTFITYNRSNYDWYYTGDNSTDNTRWTTSETNKSIYDPCPSGWRVPDGGSNGVWSKALGSSLPFNYTYNSTNKGMNFSGKFGSPSTIWYPAAGRYDAETGIIVNVGIQGAYWSASPNNCYAYGLEFYDDGDVDQNGYTRAVVLSVRCIKE